jgi:phosphate transport system permease protein
MRISVKQWTAKGDPWVWLNAGAVSISLLMVVGLLALIASRGLAHFWPHSVLEAEYVNQAGKSLRVIGEVVESETVPAEQLRNSGVIVPTDVKFMDRWLIKTGNRDIQGADFSWYIADKLSNHRYPSELMTLERYEWGNFYGYLLQVKEGDVVVAAGQDAWDQFIPRLQRALEIHDRIHEIEKGAIGSINYRIERMRLQERKLELENARTPAAMADIEAVRAEQHALYESLQQELINLYGQINRDKIVALTMSGQEVEIAIAKIVRAFRPNAMGFFGKIAHYFTKVWEFISTDPREANTEGGIFPAIYGTILMVIVMAIMVTPLGVVAAVYLREYAHQGPLTRIIRIAVNNLAGVPSIVYGVFGLGFFIYFIGASIDQGFYQEALPSPTFGTPGLMWASITLAILTLPVVIVATEEGLARIPRSVREGSLALGATKAETLWRVVIPMASPAMMTGVILAIARAAGEVAPLMLVGVVKLAPSLPLDANYPFLHLDQKFMHLGFHIYDVGFQSPNVEAARPLVYATALLLVIVIALLNLSAVAIRNRLREKFKALEM